MSTHRHKIEMFVVGVLVGLLLAFLWYYAPGRVLPECARHHDQVPRYCVD